MIVFFTTAQASPISRADVSAIEIGYAKAVRAGKPDVVAALYAPDAILLPDGSPELNGRNAIGAYWGKGVEHIASLDLNTVRINALSPAYVQEVGHYTLYLKGSDKPVLGKYLVIWHEEGGKWLIASDIMNSNGS